MVQKKQWHSTRYPGVRYRESHSRPLYNSRPDRYYVIRYKRSKKLIGEACGWASEGITPSKAARWRAELVENIRTGKHPQSLKEAREIAEENATTERLEALTFAEFWKHEYFPSARQEKKERSWRTEESWFKNWIKPVIGRKPLVEISQIDIERIKSKMIKAGLSPRSVQYCLAVVRQVFNVAKRKGRFRGENPATGIGVRLGDNRRVRFLSRDEATALLDELKRRSPQLHDMALLSLRTGMRAGEIFSLTWDCIDWDQGTIFLKDTKSGRNRHAFMTKDVRKMLMRRYQGEDSSLVFLDRNGNQVKMVSRAFARAVDALGLNDGIEDPRQRIVFHSLRHTFASWLVQAGEPLYTVAKLMGHTTIALTERYSHLAPDNMRGAIERMEESLKEEKSGDKFIKLRK